MGCICSAPDRHDAATHTASAAALPSDETSTRVAPKHGNHDQRSARNNGDRNLRHPKAYSRDGTGLEPTKGGSMLLDSKGKAALLEQQSPPLVTKASAIPLLWQPGTEITRPVDTSGVQLTYIPLPNGKYLRLSYGAISRQGHSTRRGGKANQDSWLVAPALGGNPESFLTAVFDGHGPKGEDAAHYCAVHMTTLLQAQPDFQHNVFRALRSSFEPLHQGYVRAAAAAHKAGLHADPNVSGTTAITVLLHGDRFACANVGDSRAVMFSETDSASHLFPCPASASSNGDKTASKASGSSLPKDVIRSADVEIEAGWNENTGGTATGAPRSHWIPIPLSRDHKPSREDERRRVEASEAVIISERDLGIVDGDPSKLYICRTTHGVTQYGVLFTRSLGDADAHAHLGLIAAPETVESVITDEIRAIVLASDGVWDVCDESAVARILQEAPRRPLGAILPDAMDVEDVTAVLAEAADGQAANPSEANTGADGEVGAVAKRSTIPDAQYAVEVLVERATEAWKRDSPGRRDDITAIVLFCDFVDAKNAESEMKALAPGV